MLEKLDISYEILIVDNASDAQPEQYHQLDSRTIRNIYLPDNVGFAKAVNIGLKNSQSEYVLLLNPDVEITSESLTTLLDHLKSNSELAIIGPKLIDRNGNLDAACRRLFPRYVDIWYIMLGFHLMFPDSREFGRFNLSYMDPDEMAYVDMVSGASLLAKREAINEVGLMDEQFFLFGEDIDWCYRFRLKGWLVCYFPEVVATHVKHTSMKHAGWRPAIEFYRAIAILYYKYIYPEIPFLYHVAAAAMFWINGSIGVFERRIRFLISTSTPDQTT